MSHHLSCLFVTCDAAVYSAHDFCFGFLVFPTWLVPCEVPRTTLSFVLAFYVRYVQSYRLRRLSEYVSCLLFFQLTLCLLAYPIPSRPFARHPVSLVRKALVRPIRWVSYYLDGDRRGYLKRVYLSPCQERTCMSRVCHFVFLFF